MSRSVHFAMAYGDNCLMNCSMLCTDTVGYLRDICAYLGIFRPGVNTMWLHDERLGGLPQSRSLMLGELHIDDQLIEIRYATTYELE